MYASKKMRVVAIIVVFFISSECNGMEHSPSKLTKGLSFSKKNNEKVSQQDVAAEHINPENLPDFIGKTVLWKKNSKHFYVVQLGERVGNTRSYQIYQTSDSDKQTKAGVVCPDDQLYKLMEGKEKL